MKPVALIIGSGLTAELLPLVLEVIRASGAEVDWRRVDVVIGEQATLEEAALKVEECGVGLKTRLVSRATDGRNEPQGVHNPNVQLRQRLDLYAGVLPIRPLPGLRGRYEDVDLVLIRENTEDIYKGIEHEIVDGVVESLKVVTRDACDRIARFTFAAVRTLGRKHVTFIHKANIMKRSDGLFLDTVRKVAKENTDIGFREIIVDAACMQLVLDPYQFDVLLAGNLYGDILSNLGSGLAGGISNVYAINIGDRNRVYEAIHGDAPHLEGTGQGNPLPLLMPALALIEHLGFESEAQAVRTAVGRVLAGDGPRTPDLGGTSGTADLISAILSDLGR